jgi:hypothetical protein
VRCQRPAVFSKSAPAGHSDPVGDALHHHRLDAEITVRRTPSARIGTFGDLAARHHRQLPPRRARQGREHHWCVARWGLRAGVVFIADDEHGHCDGARLGVEDRLAATDRPGYRRSQDGAGYLGAQTRCALDSRRRALARSDQPNGQRGPRAAKVNCLADRLGIGRQMPAPEQRRPVGCVRQNNVKSLADPLTARSYDAHQAASRPRCANTSWRSSARCASPRWRG